MCNMDTFLKHTAVAVHTIWHTRDSVCSLIYIFNTLTKLVTIQAKARTLSFEPNFSNLCMNTGKERRLVLALAHFVFPLRNSENS